MLEDKKVHEESVDYKRQREEVVRNFELLQTKLVELLEENLAERPLHQLSLSEFNLHQEAKKERLKAVRFLDRNPASNPRGQLKFDGFCF